MCSEALPIRRPSAAVLAVLAAASLWGIAARAAAPASDPPAETTEGDDLKEAGREPGSAAGAFLGSSPQVRPPASVTATGDGRLLASPPLVPSGPRAEIVWGRPAPTPPDMTPHWVPVEPSDRSRGSADAGLLAGIRVLSLKAGAAEVQLSGEPMPRQVRVGDRIGTDTLLRIEAARLVLSRPAGPEEKGEAMVVVKVGRAGLSRVRVYSRKDPGPPPLSVAPEGQ